MTDTQAPILSTSHPLGEMSCISLTCTTTYRSATCCSKNAHLRHLTEYITYFPLLSKFARSNSQPRLGALGHVGFNSMWKLWRNIDNTRIRQNVQKCSTQYPVYVAEFDFSNLKVSKETRKKNVEASASARLIRGIWYTECLCGIHSRSFHTIVFWCSRCWMDEFPVDAVPCPYPPDVAKIITAAIEGLTYVYPGNTVEQSSRPEHHILKSQNQFLCLFFEWLSVFSWPFTADTCPQFHSKQVAPVKYSFAAGRRGVGLAYWRDCRYYYVTLW